MAANAHLDRDDDLISGINVTPLVDIALVLLIVFMVTASFVARQAIPMDLPRAAHAGESTGTTLAIALGRDGSLYVDGVRRPESELPGRVREALARDKDARALVSADRDSSHGAVVRVIDVLKSGGMSRFALQIERSP